MFIVESIKFEHLFKDVKFFFDKEEDVREFIRVLKKAEGFESCDVILDENKSKTVYASVWNKKSPRKPN